MVEERRRIAKMFQGVGDGGRGGKEDKWGRGRSYIKVLITTLKLLP